MIFAAILAGGIGTRLNLGFPKQFYEINNKPLLIYCIEQFLQVEEIDKIIVSSPEEFINKTNDIIEEFIKNSDRIVVIKGGQTRNGTILNSIDYAISNGADDESILITHDGARIFVPPILIKNSIKYAKQYGAASPVIPATDVIFKSKNGNLVEIPERKYLSHAQTPQSFNIQKFLNIYEDLSSEEIDLLDEAMMLFYLRNEKVYLFEGDSINFKITRPFDMKVAESILNY